MRRTRLSILVCAMLGCLAAPWDASPCAGDDEKKQRGDAEKAASEEILVFGADLNQLLESVPGAVLLSGDKAKEYLAAQKGERRDGPALTVQQCIMRGDLQTDVATMHVEITASSERDARGALPIGLGEANLLKLAIDGRPPILSRDSQGWVAWVEGKGQHTIVLDAQIVLAGSRNLPALAFAIPEAPLTTLELRTQRAVSDVRVVPAAPVTVRAVGDAKPQIETALGPRGKVDLRWRWSDGERREPPPLVRAESLVTATIDTGVVQMRTELSLAVLRGSQSKFELRTGPDERVLDVRRRDGTEVPFETRVEQGEQRVAVQFPDPVPGGVEIVITSQIPWSGDAASLGGMSLEGAFQHRIMLALRPASDAADFDVAVTEVSNAQRIGLDALSAPLRSPRNEAAFRASAHPFRIKLSILPRRPGTTVRSTAVLALDGNQATIFARWQFTVHGGRVPHVDFLLPENFDVRQFVLTDSVQTVRPIPPEAVAGARVARVFLKGMPETFEVRMRAGVPVLVAQNLAKLDLPWPRDAQSEASRLFLAGSPDSVLTPTPEFSATDDVLDAALTSEITTAAAALRAFRSRSPLDRVAVRIAPLVTSARYLSNVQARIDADQMVVRQTFDYPALGARLRQRRFKIPSAVSESVKLDSTDARVMSDAAGGEWVVRLAGEASEPARVQFSFRVPRDASEPPAESRAFELPLIRDLDGVADTTEIIVLHPESIGIEIDQADWKRVAPTASPAARDSFRKLGAADLVVLRQLSRSAVLQPRFLVERALIETIVGPSNEWHTHARYFITATGLGRARLKVPEHGRITQVRWAGRPIPARADPVAGTVELADDLLGDLPAVLEVECESVALLPRAWRNVPQWSAPEIVGDVSWGRVLWQLRLPDSLAVLRGPSRYSDENRLAWLGITFGVAARMDHESLSRWLGASSPAADSVTSGRAYLFSRLTSVDAIELVIVSRWLFVLISSGAVLFVGIVLISSPVKLRAWLVLVTAAGVCGFFVLEPTAAIECASAASLGALLVLVAGVSLSWLTRRSARKRTVFPEAGVLAKAQSSSQRSSSEFALGADADRAAPPAPTTTSPRRVTQSSSVR